MKDLFQRLSFTLKANADKITWTLQILIVALLVTVLVRPAKVTVEYQPTGYMPDSNQIANNYVILQLDKEDRHLEIVKYEEIRNIDTIPDSNLTRIVEDFIRRER